MTHDWFTTDPKKLPPWDTDYVFVDQSNALVAESARFLESRAHYPYDYFGDLLFRAELGSGWGHVVPSALIYADVEGTKDHMERVVARSRQLVVEEYERTDREKRIISDLVKTYFSLPLESLAEKTYYTEEDLEIALKDDPSL